MKTLILFILVVAQLLLAQCCALAAAIEITTGSGPNEGIKSASGGWLKNGSMIQIIRSGSGTPKPPDASGNPAAPDELIGKTESGYNFPFTPNQGRFDCQIWAGGNEKIYVRAWDGKTAYGDSEIYSVGGANGEVWNLSGDDDKPAIVISKRVSGTK